MISHNAQVAWDQVGWILGLWFGASLLAGLSWAARDAALARRASRARLTAQPDPAPETLNAGLTELRTLIPAQRGGGDRG